MDLDAAGVQGVLGILRRGAVMHSDTPHSVRFMIFHPKVIDGQVLHFPLRYASNRKERELLADSEQRSPILAVEFVT